MKRARQRLIDGRVYYLATSSYKKSTIENLAKYYKGKAYFRIIPGKKKGKTIYYFYLGRVFINKNKIEKETGTKVIGVKNFPNDTFLYLKKN